MVQERVDPTFELLADIDVEVGLTAASQEHRVDAMRLQPLADLFGVAVGVAGEREGRIERGDPDRAMVAVVEAPISVPGDQDVGPHLTQDAHECAAKFGAVFNRAVRHAQEDAAIHTEFGGGGLLLGFAHRAEVGWPQRRIFGALIAAGDETKADLPAVVGQLRDRTAAGELDVVGMGHHDERAARCRRLRFGHRASPSC